MPGQPSSGLRTVSCPGTQIGTSSGTIRRIVIAASAPGVHPPERRRRANGDGTNAEHNPCGVHHKRRRLGRDEAGRQARTAGLDRRPTRAQRVSQHVCSTPAQPRPRTPACGGGHYRQPCRRGKDLTMPDAPVAPAESRVPAEPAGLPDHVRRRHHRRRVLRPVHAAPAARRDGNDRADIRSGRRRWRHLVLESLPGRAQRLRQLHLLLFLRPGPVGGMGVERALPRAALDLAYLEHVASGRPRSATSSSAPGSPRPRSTRRPAGGR